MFHLISYRDPLFSIILFIFIVFIISLIIYTYQNYKELKQKKYLQNFIKGFSFLDSNEIETLLNNKKLTINSLITLAEALELNGDYEKAIIIYLELIKITNDKYTIYQKLANLYFKAGFLHKSKDMLYKILKDRPRNKKALFLLLLIHDKLNEFEDMKDVLNVLEFLGEDIEKEKIYFQLKQHLHNNDIEKLIQLYLKNPIIKREFFSKMFIGHQNEAFEYLKDEDAYDILDILWKKDIPQLGPNTKNILSAQKKISCDIEAPFELEVLKNLKKDIADLEFEYVCTECKTISPIYFTRCNNCKKVFTNKLQINLTKKL